MSANPFALDPHAPGGAFAVARAHLPACLAEAVWSGSDFDATEAPTLATGFPDLDSALPGGGWPTHAVTEVLLAQTALCEWRLLGSALARQAQDGGQIFLVAPPKTPHAGGLAQLNVPPESLVWIEAATPAERLWTTEQLVKANPKGAVLAWLPQARAEQIRRLQVHAQGCEAPVFLFRPVLAQRDASPAPLRLEVSVGLDWCLDVHILKRRGTPHEGVLCIEAVPGRLAALLTPRLMRPGRASPVVTPLLPVETTNGRTSVRAVGGTATTDRSRALQPAGH